MESHFFSALATPTTPPAEPASSQPPESNHHEPTDKEKKLFAKVLLAQPENDSDIENQVEENLFTQLGNHKQHHGDLTVSRTNLFQL